MSQEPAVKNSPEQIRIRIQRKTASNCLPWMVLLLRTALFFVFGLVGAGVFSLLGYPQPLKEIERWWGYQVLLSNIVCSLVLKALANKEQIRYRDLFGYNRATIKKSIIFILITLIPGFLITFAGMWGAERLLYGNSLAPNPSQPLPVAAAIIMTILMPVSNMLTETTTYYGYSMQRIEAQGVKPVFAVLIASFFLALQHIAFPMIFDLTYMAYKLLSYLPAALVTGYLFSRIRQLPPLMAVHLLADSFAAVSVLIVSIR